MSSRFLLLLLLLIQPGHPSVAQCNDWLVCVQGTAGQEVEAVGDLSALVNYIEPIRFHSFEHADSTLCYFVILLFILH